MSPKVSIVLPVYNGEKYIEKSINSILNQSFTDFELIIVNDCSTDNTINIINSYKDERIKIVTNEINKKLPESLNVGFGEARGEYLTWTSDDNEYLPNALKVFVEYLNSNEEVGMVYSNLELIDEKGDKIQIIELDNPENVIFTNCIGACFLYRKSVADNVGKYNKDLYLVEDYDYWLRIYMNSKIEHVAEVLYKYRTHEKSLTAKYQNEILDKTAKLWIKYFDNIIIMMGSKEDRFHFYNNILCCSRDIRINKLMSIIPKEDYDYRWTAYRILIQEFKKKLKNLFWRNK